MNEASQILDYAVPKRRWELLRERLSIASVVVLINSAIFMFGVFLDSFGGEIDKFGALLCRSTYSTGNVLFVVAPLYSALRRFLLPQRRWDPYGTSLAIIAYLAMHALVGQRPWWLPAITGW